MARSLKFIFLIALVSVVADCKSSRSPDNTVLNKINAGALIVDVRTTEEFSGGHYPGALNIPVSEVEARVAEFGADKNRPIVVYCRSGARSGRAQGILTQLGYTDVTNGGGLTDMPARGE